MRRGRTFLIRDVRVFVGDGNVIQSGSVLIRNGKIEQIFEGKAPDPKELRADLIEASGKTLLPGLIDASVRLAAPGGFYDNPKDYQTDHSLRELAAYLYSGVTAVRSVGDQPQSLAVALQRYAKGDYLGTELFVLSGQPARVYLPGLAQIEAAEELAQGKTDGLDRTLVQQVGPAGLLESTKRAIVKGARPELPTANLRTAMEELKRAWESGIPLAAGSNSGVPLLIHGPALHRELQLWVQAGIPAYIALQSATSGNAKLVGAEGRLGLIKPGYPATLLLINGNPLTDISTTENIASVFFRGERVERSGLFAQE
jgi:imidazolonepropionase-like amidohydrolase